MELAFVYEHPEVASDYIHFKQQAERIVGQVNPKTVGLWTWKLVAYCGPLFPEIIECE